TAIFWSLAATLVAALATGTLALPTTLFQLPQLSLPGLSIDLMGALQLRYLPLVLVILFFALFDTLGTLLGLAHEAGLLRDNELPRLERALAADALGMVGG